MQKHVVLRAYAAWMMLWARSIPLSRQLSHARALCWACLDHGRHDCETDHGRSHARSLAGLCCRRHLRRSLPPTSWCP